MKRKLLLLFFVFIGGFISIFGANNESMNVLSDSSRISLLTSTPWNKEIYALFGHTAIRIEDPVNKIDAVFNYGIFDFSSPNFMGRFVRGETDYRVAAADFEYYLMEYQMRGVGVIEQVLNLTKDERQRIWYALLVNLRPENAVYRYNYFYDNCSTRPRDIIEQNIDGKVDYTVTKTEQTYRDLVHECVDGEPWVRFGIDLVIGSGADRMISDREKDFLPIYLMNAYKGASIIGEDGSVRQLVTVDHFLTLDDKTDKIVEMNYPLIGGIVLLFLTVFLSFLSYNKRCFWVGRLFDTFLFAIAGVGGCIIFFLLFFSVHPCVNPNWNIAWLNPLQLIVASLFFVKTSIKYLYYYHFINFAALVLFLLAWGLIPQYLEIAFVPYILALLIRSGMNIWLRYSKMI